MRSSHKMSFIQPHKETFERTCCKSTGLVFLDTVEQGVLYTFLVNRLTSEQAWRAFTWPHDAS